MQFLFLLIGATALFSACATRQNSASGSHSPELSEYIAERRAEIDTLKPERREMLDRLAAIIAQRFSDEVLPITFICTHNSRRSQMSQVWAAIAAKEYGFDNVTTHSGGTEATTFHPHAVAALERAGFDVAATTGGENPVYEIDLGRQGDPLECFSKTFGDDSNPAEGFVAVMTCSDADDACPFVPGAAERIAVTYRDPKEFDGTPSESEAYDERCAQIARELLYVFRTASS